MMRKSVSGQFVRSNAEIAVISTDLNGKVTVFNQSAQQILGYKPTEIIGKKAPIQEFSKLKETVHLQELLPTPEAFVHKNGDLIGMEVISSAIKNGEGDTTGLLFTATRAPIDEHVHSVQDLPDKAIFDVILDRELRRMQREQRPLSLLQIDIDFYKPYRDTYGAEATELCLTQVARILDERVQRAGDFLAYHDHDEFLIILPNTDRSGTVKVAEQLRLLIQNAGIENKASELGDTLTVSIGIANVKPTRDTLSDELLEEATAQLKQAKTDGRNCSRIGE